MACAVYEQYRQLKHYWPLWKNMWSWKDNTKMVFKDRMWECERESTDSGRVY